MKSSLYGQLLNEHTRVGNKISEIKSQSIDLTDLQKIEIKNLEQKQLKIINDIKNLFK